MGLMFISERNYNAVEHYITPHLLPKHGHAFSCFMSQNFFWPAFGREYVTGSSAKNFSSYVISFLMHLCIIYQARRIFALAYINYVVSTPTSGRLVRSGGSRQGCHRESKNCLQLLWG